MNPLHWAYPLDRLVAVCQRVKYFQPIPVLDLPLPTPQTTGSEWIAAYRRWNRWAMPVTWCEFEFAFSASDAEPGAQSWIHELTSLVRLSFDGEEGGGPPPDDEASWHPMPDAQELDLKQRLVDNFVAAECPSLHDEVRRCFSHRGAWRAFKDLLNRRRLLDQWHHYENMATQRALLAWAAERGVGVVDAPVDSGPTGKPS